MPDVAWTYALLCLCAFFAGVLNSIAGGGTLLTFPPLMTALSPLGLQAAAFANATSTVAGLFLVQAPIARWIKGHRPDREPTSSVQVALVAFQFLIALYGGYFGAGIGILMIATLTFMGVGDIHRVNGVKTFLATMINGASVIVFIGYGFVHWKYALAMAGS